MNLSNCSTPKTSCEGKVGGTVQGIRTVPANVTPGPSQPEVSGSNSSRRICPRFFILRTLSRLLHSSHCCLHLSESDVVLQVNWRVKTLGKVPPKRTQKGVETGGIVESPLLCPDHLEKPSEQVWNLLLGCFC